MLRWNGRFRAGKGVRIFENGKLHALFRFTTDLPPFIPESEPATTGVKNYYNL